MAGIGQPVHRRYSHAAAGMVKAYYQQHPAFERFLSASVGRGKLSKPPGVFGAPRAHQSRFMNVHRLFTWADRVLKLQPAGSARWARPSQVAAAS